MNNSTDLLIWGFVAHVLADWILQNEWMALNKVSLRHPAAWVHGGIHLVCLLSVFPASTAVVLAVSHILVDTRKPLIWWRKVYRQTADGPAFIPFAMWQDQAVHILCIAVAALIVGITK